MLEVSERTTLGTPALPSETGVASFLGTAYAIAAKDVRSELRSRSAVNGSLVFGLLVVVIFNFALNLEGDAATETGSGALWVAIVLAAMMGFNFIFAHEREQGGMEGLLLSSADPGAIFFGKLAGALLFTLALEAFLFPVFALFANVSILSPALPALVLLGTLGFVTVGTLFSAMAVTSRSRELFLPLLLLPVAVPVLIASVEGTRIAIQGDPWKDLLPALSVLGAFDVVFLAISPALFQFVTEEMAS
jgi:heme exporter protein B